MGAGHSHGATTPSGTAAGRHKTRLMGALALTTIFMAVEVVGGLWTGSLALLADAAHMLTDAGGLALALLAIRDNEMAAKSQGIHVGGMKLAVYLVAAFGAGLAGALYFVGNLRISPDAAFSVNWTAFAIFMVMIGGLGRIEGPIIGALPFWVLNKFLNDYGSWHLMGLGLLAMVVTIKFKQGLWGYVQQRWGWSLFPTARQLQLDTQAPLGQGRATRQLQLDMQAPLGQGRAA